VRGLPVSFKSKLDPSYTSGDPKTKDPGDGSAANIQYKAFIAYGIATPAANDDVVKIALEGGGYAIGKLGSPGGTINASQWGGQVIATPGNTVTHLQALTERSKTGLGSDSYSDVKRFYLGVRGRLRITLQLSRSAATTVSAKGQLELLDGTRVDCTTVANSTTNNPSFSSHTLDMNVTADHEGMLLVVQYKNDNTAQTAYIKNVEIKYDETSTMPARHSSVITD
jgi:hypothetical protein